MVSLKEHIKGKVPDNVLDEIKRSFEIVGDIAIIEIPESIKKYEKLIGRSLIDVNSNIKVVLKKEGIHKGKYRTQDLIHIAGENRKETIYQENGIKLKLNVEEVYFSAKLGTERKELCTKIKEDSKILVMFSGCGPYTFNIIKTQVDIELIDSIEINPIAHKYALENLEINKNLLKKSKEFQARVSKLKKEERYINEKDLIKELNSKKINFYCGDVREIIKKQLYNKKYDEIFMPLPKDAQMFLDEVFKVTAKNAIVHMYDFIHENDFPHICEKKILDFAKKENRKIKILRTRKVGQYSPRKYRVCCDFIVK